MRAISETVPTVQAKQHLGKTFLELPAIRAYGAWIIIVLFPLVLAGIIFLIDENRSLNALLISAIAIGIVAASYMFRLYLVRNSESLRSRVLAAKDSEEVLLVISGGLWWWLVTIICAITAAVTSHGLL